MSRVNEGSSRASHCSQGRLTTWLAGSKCREVLSFLVRELADTLDGSQKLQGDEETCQPNSALPRDRPPPWDRTPRDLPTT